MYSQTDPSPTYLYSSIHIEAQPSRTSPPLLHRLHKFHHLWIHSSQPTNARPKFFRPKKSNILPEFRPTHNPNFTIGPDVSSILYPSFILTALSASPQLIPFTRKTESSIRIPLGFEERLRSKPSQSDAIGPDLGGVSQSLLLQVMFRSGKWKLFWRGKWRTKQVEHEALHFAPTPPQ